MNEAAATPAAPIPFHAAGAALEAINQSVKEAQLSSTGAPIAAEPPAADAGPEPALSALLMLREIREQLAGWESGLIETARRQGASWADLAGPLGVASRQAAERRYLRLRPG
ncbi:HSP18 transcriptional regulator, partial [Streptomyces fagopyri]